jgi:hypothetical protein
VLVVVDRRPSNDLELTCRVVAAGLGPWVDGRRTDLVRITPGFISGRRIIQADPDA